MNRSAPAVRTPRCPGCGATCAYAVDNPYRPFCSARCKNNDFGAWASERFSVKADGGADGGADAGVDAGVGAGIEPALPGDDADASGPANPRQRDNQ